MVAFAEQFEHVEGGVVPGFLNVVDDFFERVDGFAWYHELVLQEAVGAVAAVPLTDEVEGLVELGEVLDLVAVGAAEGAVGFADGDHHVFVHPPVGEHVGDGEQLGGVELEGAFRQFGGVFLQLVEGGEGAAGDGGLPECEWGADGVEPGGGVGVVYFGAVGVEGDGFVQGVGDVAVGNEVGGFGARHFDGGAQDNAGEAHAADGGPEETAVGVVGGAGGF